MYSSYKSNASRINKRSKGYKMLELIIRNSGATKYECLQEIGKQGTKKQLRGYYSVYFQGWVKNKVVSYESKHHKYKITNHGKMMFLKASAKE